MPGVLPRPFVPSAYIARYEFLHWKNIIPNLCRIRAVDCNRPFLRENIMNRTGTWLRNPKTVIVLCAVIVLGGALALTAGRSGQAGPQTGPGITTNEHFIRNLYTEIDMSDPKQVFRYIYRQLDDEVTIFPSENIYYLKFTMLGKIYYGTITMYVEDREKRVLGFAYVNREEHKSRQKHFPMKGDFYNFGSKDGLEMKKIDEFTYTVTYLGKTVTFHLFNDGIKPPQKARLRPDEVFVGPSFDESGLRFFLIYNKTVSRLYWVLNEDGFVPETFYNLSDNILIGDRTEFAFYNDRENNRKIMVGVEGENVLQNNWYDGPFDQLPDNYVKTGQLRVQEYLEGHYPYYKDKIDKYGNFLGKEGSRVAVAPYKVYFTHRDLDFIDSLKNTGMQPPALYEAITEQVFDVPESYFDEVASAKKESKEKEQ